MSLTISRKIYIASSWKNADFLFAIASELEQGGHQVDLFCDELSGRYVFDYRELKNYQNMHAITFLQQPKVRRAFKEDKKWIDWADCVVLVLPCGRSAHLEAGYAVGKGKKLYIFAGDFPMGEFDVMYGFADGLYTGLADLLEAIKH